MGQVERDGENERDHIIFEAFLNTLKKFKDAPPLETVYVPNQKMQLFNRAADVFSKYKPKVSKYFSHLDLKMRGSYFSFDKEELEIIQSADIFTVSPNLDDTVDIVLSFRDVFTDFGTHES